MDRDLPHVTEWKPGDPLAVPTWTMRSIAMDSLSTRETYKLIISAITPRPIALISTVSAGGARNLAPFSFFSGVGTTPPAVMFSIVPKNDGAKKDTLRNIEETGEFVVNGVSEWMLAPVHHTSGEYAHGEDEAALVGFETCPSVRVRPPRISGAIWQFECERCGTLQVGEGGPGSGTVVVGRIVQAHVAAEAFVDGAIVFEKLAPVARIGGMGYALAGSTITMPVIDYAPK